MGLDMYLSAKKYVAGYDHCSDIEKRQFLSVLNAVGLDDSHSRRCYTPGAYVEVTVAYWRKANCIHNWFVDNVQSGTDDCGSYYVERSQLESLLALCKEVLGTIETVEGDVSTGTAYYPDGRVEHLSKRGPVVAQTAIAAKKLPTKDGFFFGGTAYDECYLEDLHVTVDMLEAVLTDERLEGWDFKYHASW